VIARISEQDADAQIAARQDVPAEDAARQDVPAGDSAKLAARTRPARKRPLGPSLGD
jgi:hypothetical protein